MKSILERFTPIHSPSGFEDSLTDIIQNILSPQVGEVDFMGNLSLKIPGQGPKILVVSSVDEPSLVVTHIDSDGFIRFYPSGNLGVSNVISQQVIFSSGITGFVGSEKNPDDGSRLGFDNLFIDIGAKNKKQAQEFVQIGDHPAFNIPVRVDGNTILGRDDCKIPAGIATFVAGEVGQTQNHLVFGFTTQSKLSGRGAMTVVSKENPDLIINISTVTATDTPNHKKNNRIELGAGPVLVVQGSNVYRHLETNNIVKEIAQTANIPLQLTIEEETKFTEYRMNTAQASVPLVTLAVPVRLFGKFGAIADIRDATDACKLLIKTLRKKLI